MDPRRVLLLRDVLRAGSMSAAARELGWTQPAVSQQLAILEREAGVPLLLRTPRGVRPTEAGEVLLRRADAVARELHMADEEIVAFSRLRRGVVRLVTFPTAAATLVPHAAARMKARHPEIDVVLLEAEPPEALGLLESGGADLALVFRYAADPVAAVVWHPIADEPIDLVVADSHPLAAAPEGPVHVEDLATDTWIAGCVRCREHLVAVCAEHDFTPRIDHTTDDFVVVQNLVAAGLGVSVLPRSALTAYRHPGIRTRDGVFGSRTIGVAHREGADAVPATRALLRELLAQGSVSAS